MKITTKPRTQLKSYFITKSIPTESNFADLVDGSLNQRDDGVVRLPGNPLSIEAAGDAGSEKKTLDLYGSFADTAPSWSLSLNPRVNPNDAASAKPGLNIADEQGKSRLFISKGTGNVGIGTLTPGAALDVKGTIRAEGIESTNEHRHRMYPDGPLVCQDIFDAVKDGRIAKLGNPAFNNTSYSTTSSLWYDRRIIQFGGNNEADGNGALITIPDGYDTAWVRVLGERWNAIHAYYTDGGKEDLKLWFGGFRSTNCYCPDGSLSDSSQDKHQWMPIPAGRAGTLALISKHNTDKEFWVSGLAFSKNPWAHAVQPAVGYHWGLNGGDPTAWNTDWHKWKSDSLTKLNAAKVHNLKVPVVASGRDKLLYMVEHNSDWNGCMHNGLKVNGTPIERFLSTYDNPFARHWNSKYYERYIAARIPASLITAGTRMLDVQIDLSKQDEGIHFREMGTHDLEIPRAS